MNIEQKIIIFLATGGFVGKIPFAPGTFGTLVGIPLCYLLSKIELTIAFLMVVVLIVFSIPICHEAAKIIGDKDPGSIIIDEIVGIVITLFAMPFTTFMVISSFLLFRCFDILKPFPIRFLDKSVTGGMGIIIDDITAGILSNISLRIILYFVE